MNSIEPLWIILGKLLAPVVAALVASLVAIYAFRANAKITRNETLLAKRREIYSEYAKTLQLNMIGHKDQSTYQAAFASIYIYGTDDVINKVSTMHKTMADNAGSIDARKAKDAYIQMIVAMRKDCFSETKLDLDELEDFLPFR